MYILYYNDYFNKIICIPIIYINYFRRITKVFSPQVYKTLVLTLSQVQILKIQSQVRYYKKYTIIIIWYFILAIKKSITRQKVSLRTLIGRIPSFVSDAIISKNDAKFIRTFRGLESPRGREFDSASDHHSVTTVTGYFHSL